MKVTEEMKINFWQGAAWPGPNDLDVQRGLEAVLKDIPEPPSPEDNAVMEAAKAYYRAGGDNESHNRLMAAVSALWVKESTE